MANLAPVDWLFVFLYLFFLLSIAMGLKPAITGSKDFLLAGRELPAWLCGLAFAGASLGSVELLGMGAAGARYGLESMAFYSLGAIVAMLFAGVYLMPIYYGSGARSVPEFLGLRFDQKTRALNAVLFAAMAIFGAGISLYAMARLMQALNLFERVGAAQRLGPYGFLIAAICVPAALVLVYVELGGLTGAMYSQVLQFLLVVAGLLPMVLLGLKSIGGWNGLKARVAATSYMHEWGSGSTGHGAGIALAVALGLVIGAGYWCTDFRVLQTAMAAKNVNAARRAPIIAAGMRIFVPLLAIVPGLIAIGMPTPQTTTVVREDNGAIIHEITVVPRAAEAGKGLVPAETDSITDPMEGKPLTDAKGRTLLNYEMAMPETMAQYLPMGLLGLALAALIACLLGGVFASVTAFNTVFTCDIYQAHIRKDASDAHYLAVGRWAAVGFIVLATGAGCAAIRLNNLLEALATVFAVVNAPLLATVLLGMFWKRATGHGAFAGLLAGVAAAVLHLGLTLPESAQRGWSGGWWGVAHHYPSALTQSLWTAIIAFAANLAVAVLVSLRTKAKADEDLKGLVHGLTKAQTNPRIWWMQPERLAVVVLVVAVALCFVLP